jgi:chemotaxis protein MotB
MPVASSGQRRGGRGSVNYWPGFVDALSTLLLAIVFMISIFMVGQFFLAREISGRDTVLDRLNRQIAELTDLRRRRSPASRRPSAPPRRSVRACRA